MDKDFKLEDTLEYLKEDKNNYVYINFSSSNVGKLITCIDRSSYGNDYFDEDEEDAVYDEENGATMLDDSSNFGYIVQYKKSTFKSKNIENLST